MRRSLRGARDEEDFRCAQAELAGLREAAAGGEFDLYEAGSKRKTRLIQKVQIMSDEKDSDKSAISFLPMLKQAI
jgi:hypothetical protein